MQFNMDSSIATLSRDRLSTYVAEASEIGITAKHIAEHGWPKEIGDPDKMGNGQPLRPIARKIEDGELLYVRYRQLNGCISLIVFND